jgi:hypothetical protein
MLEEPSNEEILEEIINKMKRYSNIKDIYHPNENTYFHIKKRILIDEISSLIRLYLRRYDKGFNIPIETNRGFFVFEDKESFFYLRHSWNCRRFLNMTTTKISDNELILKVFLEYPKLIISSLKNAIKKQEEIKKKEEEARKETFEIFKPILTLEELL